MWRLAIASTWSGSSTDRRRAALLSASAAAVAMLALGCCSAWWLSTRVHDRATVRSFAPAADGAPAALTRATLFDEAADGRQIYVEVLRITDPAVRIQGVPGPPRAGTWWVTRALADRFASQPALAHRYPGARILSRSGTAHRGELLAYHLLGAGPDLPERLSRAPSSDWIGDGGDVVDLYPIVIAGLGLVGIPGAGLLLAAMGASAGSLERRRLLLRSLGASRTTELALVGAHVGVVALPGALAGGFGWWLLAPRLRSVPFVGRSVFRGDLALPLGVVLMGSSAVAVLTLLVAVLRRRARLGPRRTALVPTTPPAARAVPLVAALGVLAAGVAVPGRAGAQVFLMGVVACTLGAVVALPYVIARVGTRVATGSSLLALLVGRRLAWHARTAARSLLAVGALACLVPVLGAWVSVARHLDPADRRPSGSVEIHGPMPDHDVRSLERTTGATAERDGTVGATRFVTTRAGAPALEDAARAYVVDGERPGLQVRVPGRDVSHESPLVGWILGAARVAGLVGLGALGLHLAAQSAEHGRTRIRLAAVGADIGFLRRLVGIEAAGSVALVGLGCTAVGAADSWMFVQRDATAQVPWVVIVLVALAVTTAAVVSGVAAALALPSGRDRRPISPRR
jgi:hypothetical protein